MSVVAYLRYAVWTFPTFVTLLYLVEPALAQCAFIPTAGDDLHSCESGISASGLTDQLGNNTLLFPLGGSGTLNGNVQFGGGLDLIEMRSGTITGLVDQGAGEDRFMISSGTVSGNVQQGAGIDDFAMTGGVIQSLNQGDNRDTFFMSGGRIINFFDDGDLAIMTGGRIGRVNMMLDNNLFDMSGGRIDSNLVAGFGNDTITISNGFIGGNVSVSGGTDNVTVTGGSIGGQVLLSAGTDRFDWIAGGTISGRIDAGPDDDRFTFTGLTDANLDSPQITGGEGRDVLLFRGTQTRGEGRYVGWESISLSQGSQFTISEPLVLGDAGTGTGTLSIDSTSRLLAGGAGSRIQSITAGQTAVVSNAGTIDLTDEGQQSFNTFTIDGDYVGSSGVVQMSTALGNDTSQTDLLTVTGNTSGSTRLRIVNAGGAGAPTLNGIKVVEVSGSSDGTFSLLGDYVFNGQPTLVAGAYSYRLFKHGLGTPSDSDWYLRSGLVPGDPIDPDVPALPQQPGTPSEPGQPSTPQIPFYQPGAPVFEIYPQILLGLNELPTLQQRLGNRYWSGNGAGVAAEGADVVGEQAAIGTEPIDEGRGIWGRLEGTHARLRPETTATGLDYDYSLYRIEAGIDLPLAQSATGVLVGGLSVNYGNAHADVSSMFGDGRIDVDGIGARGTLTWFDISGFYLDAQASSIWFGSDLRSDQLGALSDDNDAFGYALSIEGGRQFEIGNGLKITPQAQLVYSSVDFEDFEQTINGNDIANVSLLDGESLRGRAGLTLDKQRSWQADNGTITRSHAYGIANLYYEFLDGTAVDVSNTSLANSNDRFWGGLGLGASYNWKDDAYSIYGEALANTSFENFGDSYELKATAGFRIRF